MLLLAGVIAGLLGNTLTGSPLRTGEAAGGCGVMAEECAGDGADARHPECCEAAHEPDGEPAECPEHPGEHHHHHHHSSGCCHVGPWWFAEGGGHQRLALPFPSRSGFAFECEREPEPPYLSEDKPPLV